MQAFCFHKFQEQLRLLDRRPCMALGVIAAVVVVKGSLFVALAVCQHKTAPTPDPKRKTLLSRNTTIGIAPLFVAEGTGKEVRLSLCLTVLKTLDGIKIGLAQANDA